MRGGGGVSIVVFWFDLAVEEVVVVARCKGEDDAGCAMRRNEVAERSAEPRGTLEL